MSVDGALLSVRTRASREIGTTERREESLVMAWGCGTRWGADGKWRMERRR